MKKKRMLAAALAFVSLFSLTGCWDAKEIQHISYVTAIGIDYEKNRFIVYAQMLDFTSVAKQEGGKPSEVAHVWVSKTSGISLNEAIDKLYRSAQQLFYYSHINAIIYSENALRNAGDVLFDLTNRYREIRYTKWAFGSRAPMEQLLSTTPFFNESPLSSVLHEPKESYRQNSYIMPLQFQRFISYYYEKGKTSYLPTLALNRSTWKDNRKKHTLLEVNGSFFMDHQGKMKGFLSHEDLIGLRWFNPDTVRTPLFLSKNGKFAATIVLRKPKVSIEPVKDGGKLTFRVHIRLTGSVNELGQTIAEAELQELAQKQVIKEIKDTYANGLKHQIDLYQLGYALYLHDPATWKTYFGPKQAFPLQADSLEPLTVTVTIENTGKYHLRK